MNFRNMLIGMVSVLSLAACSNANDSKQGTASVGAPALVDSKNNVIEGYEAGIPNFIFNAPPGQLSVDGTVIGHLDETTFAGFPMLASQIAELSTVSKVIQTKENTLELWSGDSLVLVFDLRTDSPQLLHSRSGSFQLEHAAFSMNAGGQGQGQGQGLNTATLTVDMRECMVEQTKEQEQGKFEQAPIDQGKDQTMPLDQGKKFIFADAVAPDDVNAPAPDDMNAPAPEDTTAPDDTTAPLPDDSSDLTDEKKHNQGQEQGKGEICKMASYTWLLNEIIETKPVDQGKFEPAPIDQGKDQSKPVDQGQEQGKLAPAPIDQGKDQSKPVDQGQEQGKLEPAPIDQGKDQSKPVDQGQSQDLGKKS